MAIINKIYETSSTKNSKNITTAEMEITTTDNNRYLVLSTFGSNTRKEKGKASQIIHLDKETASELASILQKWIKKV